MVQKFGLRESLQVGQQGGLCLVDEVLVEAREDSKIDLKAALKHLRLEHLKVNHVFILTALVKMNLK